MLQNLVAVSVDVFGRLIAVDVLDLSVHEDGMTDVVFTGAREALLHLVLQLHVILRREAETRSAIHKQIHLTMRNRTQTLRKPTLRLKSDLMTFSMHARCRKKALTTGAPCGTSGALQRKLSSDRTL